MLIDGQRHAACVMMARGVLWIFGLYRVRVL